ncbi:MULTISPECIES: head GIN domain-containing protein [Microbacterium]|uniref:head GIN domain-containing protein n=1 Tax=Microbacterium TaxID=33882 RepID=UPI00146A38C2|nr:MULTISPECIES: head GIN domain-containing protein [Microbacterium]
MMPRAASAGGRRATTATAVLTCGLAVTACMPMFPGGPASSEERAVDDVTRVVLGTSGELSIAEGDPALVIHAPEDAMGRLTSEVNGDTLVLGESPGFMFGFGSVRYELTLPRLEAVELNGSGDVDARVAGDGSVQVRLNGSGDVSWTGLDADRVEIRIAGSGDASVSGTAADVSIEIDGSGDVDTMDLDARDVAVVIRGSGDADVSATEELAAQIAGSGSVTYSGDPRLDTEVWGSGEVVRR